VTPRGREFQLPAEAVWFDPSGKAAAAPVRAQDVRYSVNELLKKGRGEGRAPAWGDLLEEVRSPESSRVTLTLTQGWLEPLAPMQFKVLPVAAAADEAAFASHPVGSGPFAFAGLEDAGDGKTQFARFVANPHYGARAGRAGRPHLQEIHFFQYNVARDKDGKEKTQVEDDIRTLHLNLALDLTAAEAAALRQKAGDLRVRVPPPAGPNRRIWFLAVDHHTPALQNAALRLALADAIDREAVLDRCFRGGVKEAHKALNGPYPAGSWACNPDLKGPTHKDSLDPFDEAAAKALRAQAATEAGLRDVSLDLSYPTGDPAVKAAVDDICDQVKKRLGIDLKPVPRSPEDLRKDVEETHAYQLAYYHYDFPDDVYWLGPLLGPHGDASGGNLFRYQGPLATMVEDETLQRDFGQARDAAHKIHEKFLRDEMPFIPLWQLDAYAAVGSDVTAPPFDPLLVFPDADQWKLGER
jgi:ABC-type oligopeptide transport system substrate-binding subunit